MVKVLLHRNYPVAGRKKKLPSDTMKINIPDAECFSLRTRTNCSKLLNSKWLSFLLLIAVLAGCKKVNEEIGLTSLCPAIISTSPIHQAVGVSLYTQVAATFNKALNPGSVNSNTFTLKQGTNLVAGLVTYTGVTATFTPAVSLTANTMYVATISTGVKDPGNNAMVDNYTWSFTTGAPDVIPPVVTSTDPLNAAIGVVFDKKISATFSEAMDSLSTTSNFSLTNTTLGGQAIPGTITYAGTTALFSPLVNLAAGTTYTARIIKNAKDLSGNKMANDYVWNFTTAGPVTPPTILSTDPANLAVDVATGKVISALFSKLMNPVTLNNTTFLLKQGLTTIAGNVTYTGSTASFSPLVGLASNTLYTATITTGAKDPSGTSMLTDYTWTFRTAVTMVPPNILGAAAMFGAFGGNAGITNQGLNTVINNGSLGTTAASSLITGFHEGNNIYTETPLNVGNVTGKIYTAPPFPGDATSFAVATKGLLDATTAYLSISPAAKPGGIDPGAGELGGLTLAPGIYKSASGTFNISNGNLTLDAKGDPNAEWIFQTASGLTVGIAGPMGAKSVLLINGAMAKNVYWYVGTAATINGAGGGVMTGTIIANSGVTFSTAGNAAQTVLNGRAISLVASVTMVNTTINVPN